MNSNKIKDGVSVKEIEDFAKKHRFEVFFCLAFVLAYIFSFVFFKAGCLLFATAGGILGALFPAHAYNATKNALKFVFKQDKTVQIVLGIVVLILCIFLQPLTFFVVGVIGGRGLVQIANEVNSSKDS